MGSIGWGDAGISQEIRFKYDSIKANNRVSYEKNRLQ